MRGRHLGGERHRLVGGMADRLRQVRQRLVGERRQDDAPLLAGVALPAAELPERRVVPP